MQLLEAGYAWAEANLDFKYRIPADARDRAADRRQRQHRARARRARLGHGDLRDVSDHAGDLGVALPVSDVFEKVGGIVHQAEDEIAACAFAIGASYAGKCAVTITSGPGYSLKQEAIGLAVMAEIPLVVVNVQRGGPSTGQPTKAEQGDLLTAIFGSHGDAPKVVMAPSTIEDCFYSMITARKIAETFNMVVVVLSDASLATAQQPFPRPQFSEAWLAPPIDQSAGARRAPSRTTGTPTTGLARRFIPGQPGGMHTLTGLAHDRVSHVAYDPEINEEGLRARSLKLAALQKTLKTPPVFGDAEGRPAGHRLGQHQGRDRGSGRRACAREGRKVSSLHLRFLQPMPSGHQGDHAALQAR